MLFDEITVSALIKLDKPASSEKAGGGCARAVS